MTGIRTSDWDGRANNFDFLRLALAVLVIYSHSYALGLGDERLEPVKRLTHGQMTGGAVAVDLFFVMSGFLIAASAERTRGTWAFMKKRVARIYPGFCALALLTAIFLVPWSGGRMAAPDLVGRAGNFFLQTLRLREFGYVGAFQHNPYRGEFPWRGAINGSVWSIQYEFWCYVGVAGLAAAGMLKRRWVVLGLFLAAWGVSLAFEVKGIVLGGKWAGVVLGSPQLWARLLPLYLAGVAFYLWRDRVRWSWWGAGAAVVGLGAGCWMRFGLTALFPLAGTYLVFWLAYAPWLKVNGFGRYGDFSYGTYLYAFPVEQLIVRGMGHGVAPWVLFPLATPVTLGLRFVAGFGVERRFLRVGRRKMELG